MSRSVVANNQPKESHGGSPREQVLAEIQGGGASQFIQFNAEAGPPVRSVGVDVDVNVTQIAFVSEEPVSLG